MKALKLFFNGKFVGFADKDGAIHPSPITFTVYQHHLIQWKRAGYETQIVAF